MTAASRRSFLRLVGLSSLGFGLAPRAAVAQQRSASAPTLVCVLLRGAVDGLSVVIPYREQLYYAERPTIALPPPGRSSDVPTALDGRFALHPALSSVLPLWRDGELAFVHAAGSPHPTRSHFEAQYHMESGVIGRLADRRGWLNRCLAELPASDAVLRAVSTSDHVPLMLRGREPAFALGRSLRRTRSFSANTRRLVEQGLGAMYGTAVDTDAVRTSGLRALRARRVLAGLRGRPRGGARSRGLSAALATVAWLVEADVGLEVAFVDAGGWDTHAAQGAGDGPLARRLRGLADALGTFRSRLGDRMERVVLVVLSEFGRTVAENGAGGTDHGHGTVMWVLGGPVHGRRVLGTWPGLAPDRRFEGRDLAVTTDFRDVLAEVLTGHLGLRDPTQVFPGWEAPARYPGVLRGP